MSKNDDTTDQSKEPMPGKSEGNDQIDPLISIGIGILVIMLIGILGFFLVRRITASKAKQVDPNNSIAGVPTVSLTPQVIPTKIYTPVFESETCSFQAPEGAQVTCGIVNLPENRSGDSTHTIQIAVAVYHSNSAAPNSDPILYLQGGPGGLAIDWSLSVYESVVKPLHDDRDFVVFDPRGVDYSTPALDCPEIKSTYFSDVEGKISADQKASYYEGAILTCKNNIQRLGLDVTTYTSASMAADAKDVLFALGYHQADLYGISYGTRVAQFIMRSYPEVVRSAVLDSVVPVEIQLLKPDVNAEYDQLIHSLFEDCKADPACSSSYPDLESIYNETLEQLDSQPVKITVTLNQQRTIEQRVDSSVFRNIISWSLRSSQTISVIPHLIYRTHAGDYSLLNYAGSIPLITFDSISAGVYVSVNCHDQVFASPTEGLDESIYSLCTLWGVQKPAPGENDPVNSQIPTLIIAGKYDPVTPTFFAHQLAGHLAHSYVVEISNDGHAPSANGASDCPITIITAFLNTPDSSPDLSCVDTTKAIKFDIPSDVKNSVTLKPVSISEYQINTKIPAGWSDAKFGFYYRSGMLGDFTQIGVQRSAASEAQWLVWLSTTFAGNWGFNQPATLHDHRKANGLTWSIYETSSHGNPVDIAFANVGKETLMVLLISHQDERDALYQTVFLPIIDTTISAK